MTTVMAESCSYYSELEYATGASDGCAGMPGDTTVRVLSELSSSAYRLKPTSGGWADDASTVLAAQWWDYSVFSDYCIDSMLLGIEATSEWTNCGLSAIGEQSVASQFSLLQDVECDTERGAGDPRGARKPPAPTAEEARAVDEASAKIAAGMRGLHVRNELKKGNSEKFADPDRAAKVAAKKGKAGADGNGVSVTDATARAVAEAVSTVATSAILLAAQLAAASCTQGLGDTSAAHAVAVALLRAAEPASAHSLTSTQHAATREQRPSRARPSSARPTGRPDVHRNETPILSAHAATVCSPCKAAPSEDGCVSDLSGGTPPPGRSPMEVSAQEVRLRSVRKKNKIGAEKVEKRT